MVSEIKSPFTGGKVKEIATTEKQEFRKEIFTVHARYYVYEDTGEKFTTTNQHAIMFRIKHGIPFPDEVHEAKIWTQLCSD